MYGLIFITIGCILSLICFQRVLLMSTEVILERASIDYYNKKYLSNVSVAVRRTGRRSPYYLNVEGTTLAWAGDNVTLQAVLFEYLHNEYKRTFVEFELTLCDLTQKEPWRTFLGAALMERGLVCPAPPGTYRFHNVTVLMVNFPYVWPFEKCMMQATAKETVTGEIIVRGKFYATLKRDMPKGK